MDAKYGEFTGVSDIYYALVSADTAAAYEAGTPTLLAPAASVVSTPSVTSKPTYYSNSPANNYVSEGATEVKMVIPNLPAGIMATLLGKYYDEASGRVYDDGTPTPPYIALGFKVNIGQENSRYYWFLKGTCQGGAEEGETRTDQINEKTYELTFTALVTTHKFTVGSDTKPIKRIFADDTDAAFTNGADWFSQVQTPSTSGAPDAIALSSIAPEDGAESVEVTANVVLTFNNKIADYSGIVLINSATGAVIAAASSIDTTGKIVTLDPTASLPAATKIYVGVIGVTDIFGQALASTTKSFTTA